MKLQVVKVVSLNFKIEAPIFQTFVVLLISFLVVSPTSPPAKFYLI